MKIIHVITGLNNGGAEKALYNTCINASEYKHIVISLSGKGKYGALLNSKSTEVIALGMSPGRFSLIAFFKLIKLIKKYNPDIVQTWMPHANLLGGIAARIAGINSIVWGIRNAYLIPGKAKKLTIFIDKILSKLSRWLPSRIVVNSKQSIDIHESLGYDRSKMTYIPNGLDLSVLNFNQKKRYLLRNELGLTSSFFLIGCVARYHPNKNHFTLLKSLSILNLKNISLRCVLVGKNLDHNNKELVDQINSLGLESIVILAGERNDIPDIMSALDVHVLASVTEGFPNVVGEAMACETPCIVTDVGDSAYVVGNTGWVIKPNDTKELAETIENAWIEYQKNNWQNFCLKSRKRIEMKFGIEKMVDNFSRVWEEVKNIK